MQLRRYVDHWISEIRASVARLRHTPGHAFAGAIVPSVLIRNFDTLGEIVMIISILIGLSLFYGALHQFKRYGEMRSAMSQQGSINGPLIMLVSAVLLLTLPAFIEVFLFTIWGTNNPMAYVSNGTSYDELMKAVVIFVRLIGVCAVIRGIVLLSRSGGGASAQSQPGTFSKALIHLVGGVLCINVVGTYQILHYIFFGA